MSPVPPDELFRSTDLLVRKRDGFASPCCVVTFDSFTDYRTLDRPAFGEEFFHSRGIDAVHVLSRENDWYQYPEMEAAMAAVHAATRAYGRVVTYGSSMGGYAAIRLAGLAGAHCALALSPQYSIDPEIAGFDRRWHEPSDRFKPVWERRLPFPVLDDAYVVYDPKDLDGRHAALLQAKFAYTPVPLADAGHTVSGFLNEVGLLQSLVLSVCEGTFDANALVEEAWRRRERSPQHFLARSQHARRRSERLTLLEKAVQLAPHTAAYLSHLAMELHRAKRFEEALSWHRKAVALEPTQPSGWVLYSFTLQKSGDLAAAVAMMDDVAKLTGGTSLYEKRRQLIRGHLLAREARLRRKAHLRQWVRARWQALRPTTGQRP